MKKRHILAENYKRFFGPLKEDSSLPYRVYIVPISGNGDFPKGGQFFSIESASDPRDAYIQAKAQEWNESIEDMDEYDLEELNDRADEFEETGNGAVEYASDDVEYVYIKSGSFKKREAYIAALDI